MEDHFQSILLQIQQKMKNELQMQELYIPNARAEAKCNIFVSSNYSTCSRLCLFIQSGKGVRPGIWSREFAIRHGVNGSIIPYLSSAIQTGFGVMVLNPSLNSAFVNGHKARILYSSTPEEHILHVWKMFIATSAAEQIHFISYEMGGQLVKYILSHISPDNRNRIGAVVFLESSHQVSAQDDSWLQSFLSGKAINFESSKLPMFAPIPSGRKRLGCISISTGNVAQETHNKAWAIHSIQASVFVFLQTIHQGLNDAMNALKATIPNKLIVTVNRARLTGQPYNNPYAIVQCVGQKKETIGNHKHTMDPEWNQTFSFPVNSGDASLVVTVKDKTFPIPTSLGNIVVSMAEVAQARAERRWYPLRHEKESQSHGNGEVELTLEWVHDTFVARSDSFIRGNKDRDARSSLSNESAESNCYLCRVHFVLRRRRHCRMCLRAVCVGCSDRLFLPGFSEAKRVCNACCNLQIMMHKQGQHGRVIDKQPIRQTEINLGHIGQESGGPLDISDFDLLKVVGRGAFGKVMLVRKKSGKNAGNTYAMKILKKSHIIKNDQVENTKSEQHILKEINHPFIVRLRYALQNDEKLYLVMDYYPGGSLFYHLRKSKFFSEERTRLYMAELLTAIMHLHSKQIAYRDLKLENILVDAEGHIALTDFGLSKEGQVIQGAINPSDEGMNTICGTAEYMAPELLRHQKYGKIVDWWSYGILLYEMLTGRTPFVNRNRRQMFKNILQMDVVFPPNISEPARSIISQLLNRDPAMRLGGGPNGGKDIMDHPFFSSIDWEVLLNRGIVPEFRPRVNGTDDISHIPTMFQNMEVADTPVSSVLEKSHYFEDFSFADEDCKLD